jgi:hypothetical protein
MYSTIYLRPHHLICLVHFQGKGYDEIFVSEVEKIVSVLRVNQDEKLVHIVNGCDDVCKFCCNRIENLCSQECWISELDDKFSAKLHLNKCKALSFNDMQLMANELTIEDLMNICSGCEWIQFCLSLHK